MTRSPAVLMAELVACRSAFWRLQDALDTMPGGPERDLLEAEARARIVLANALLDRAFASPVGRA